MTEYTLVPPSPDVVSHSWMPTLEGRKALYAKSIEDPDGFWSDFAKYGWDSLTQRTQCLGTFSVLVWAYIYLLVFSCTFALCILRDNFRWEKLWEGNKVSNFNYDVRKGPISVKWFEGGVTNMVCLSVGVSYCHRVTFIFPPLSFVTVSHLFSHLRILF